MISGMEGRLLGSRARRLTSSWRAPGLYWAGRGEVTPRMIFRMSAGRVGASNARLRAANSNRTHPMAQTSDLVL